MKQYIRVRPIIAGIEIVAHSATSEQCSSSGCVLVPAGDSSVCMEEERCVSIRYRLRMASTLAAQYHSQLAKLPILNGGAIKLTFYLGLISCGSHSSHELNQPLIALAESQCWSADLLLTPTSSNIYMARLTNVQLITHMF